MPEAIAANELAIPPAHQVGWWVGGSGIEPGLAVGTTLLAAHVNLDGTAGAFAGLYRAAYGDRINLTGHNGRRSTWAVVAVQTAAKSELPQSIFATSGPRRLVLVTCTGRLVARAGHGHTYESNLVVIALPVSRW